MIDATEGPVIAGGAPETGDHGSAPHKRLVVCAGTYGSASTWMFNVVSTLLRAHDPARAFARLYVDHANADLDHALATANSVVVKTHSPSPLLRLVAAAPPVRVVLTCRDPRDSTASLMQRFGMPFHLAFADVLRSVQAASLLHDLPNAMTFRYEDAFAGQPDTIAMLCRHLAIDPQDMPARTIIEQFSPDSVIATIRGLEEAGRIDLTRPATLRFDAETHWHANHVGDGTIGKFAAVLSETQTIAVEHATRRYMAMFGYQPACAGIKSGTSLEFGSDGVGSAFCSGFGEVEIGAPGRARRRPGSSSR